VPVGHSSQLTDSGPSVSAKARPSGLRQCLPFDRAQAIPENSRHRFAFAGLSDANFGKIFWRICQHAERRPNQQKCCRSDVIPRSKV
jgi:hypothetical protein